MIHKYLPALSIKILITIAAVIFAVGCGFNRSDKEKLFTKENDFISDSLFQPTGNAQLDSLLQLAAVSPADTNLAKIYKQIGYIYEDFDSEKAKDYYLKINEISNKFNWNEGRLMFADRFSVALGKEGLLDSALVILSQGLELAKKENNEEWIARMYSNKGLFYMVKEWYEMALSNNMEAIAIFEKINSTEKLGSAYYNMAATYNLLLLPEKAIEYCNKYLELQDMPQSMFVYILNEFASAYSLLQQFEISNDYYKQALEICIQQNYLYKLEEVYLQLGSNSVLLFDLDMAEMYANKMKEIYGSAEELNLYHGYLLLIGKIEMLKGNFAKSEKLILQALEIGIEYDALLLKKICYLLLSELSVALNKFEDNIRYGNELDLIEVAMAKQTAIRSSQEMEAKYETEKKELEINALKTEKHLLRFLTISVGVIFLLIITFLIILWRWTVQKRQIAEARVNQLEKEKQLIAFESILDGETKERSRLSRDLHDGLGSILAGVRLNFQEMKKGATMDYEALQCYDKGLRLLESSVREMRRVAHHLMPESLAVSGIKRATEDFILSIPHATFSYFGEELRFDHKFEEMLYRIMHELVSNALKHSGAKTIHVEISHFDKLISLCVKDDGCGFDISAVKQGMGLKNIRSRVEAFSGNLQINSVQGEGTEVNVEFEI